MKSEEEVIELDIHHPRTKEKKKSPLVIVTRSRAIKKERNDNQKVS